MTLDRRDGSLLRRKREQWAREKAEEANNNWFPFGSPGGGTPNRKFEAIEYTTIANDAKNSAMVADTSTSSCNNRSKLADSHILNNGTSENMTFTNESTFNEQIPPIMLNHQIQSTNHQELNQSTHMINSSHQQLYPFSFGFNPFPNDLGGTSIPVSSSMPWSYPYPVPLSLLPPGMKPVLQQDPNKPIPDSVCILPFISNGPEAQVTYWKQPVFAHAIDIPQNSSLSVDENDYEGLHHNNQGYIDVSKNVLREEIKEKDSPEICERSYLDEIRGSEPNHCCHQNKQTIHEVINEERKEEEKINKQRMLEEALEKAKMEAEVMRKARLYHHVLKAADGSPELEKKYLGSDSETVHRIQHELAVMDRQKLLLREELVKMLPNNKKKSDGEAKLKVG